MVKHSRHFHALVRLLTGCFAALALLAPVRLPAESLVRIWQTDHGLPEDTVRTVAQTPDGYLWLGTARGGLARFNGMNFERFTPANTPEILETGIHRLLVDRQGTLWISLLSGAVVAQQNGSFRFERAGVRKPNDWLMQVLWDRPGEKLFTTFGGSLLRRRLVDGTGQWDELEPPAASHLTQYAVDGRGRVLCASGGRVFRLEGNGFEPLPASATEASGVVHLLVSDSEGRIWAGTERGFARWEKGAFQPVAGGSRGGRVEQLVAAADGGVWVCFERELWKWRGIDWSCKAEPWGGLPELRAVRGFMVADAHGGVWCANFERGLWQVRGDGSVAREPLDHQVNSLTPDQEGNVWVALEQGGLAMLRPRFIRSFPTGPGNTPTPIHSLCEDERGNIWLGGAQHALWRLEADGFRRFPMPEEFGGAETVVFPGKGGGLWLGAILGGLWQRDTGEFTRALFPESYGSAVRVLLQDRGGGLWIGNELGLWLWQGGQLKLFQDADGFVPVQVPVAPGSATTREDRPFVQALVEDAEGALWIGLEQGELRCFKDGAFTRYRPEWAAPWMCFQSLLPDQEGGLWIGTLGAGLLHFKDGVFKRVTRKDGLPDDNICQILDDGAGQLWLGTRNGIARVPKSELRGFFAGRIPRVTALAFDMSDGLPTGQCSAGFQPACWRARDGRLWFATSAGAVAIDPKAVTVNPRPPPVSIEEVRVDGVPLPDFTPVFSSAPGHARRTRVIGPGPGHIEFHFAGLSLSAPEKVKYRWRLEGAQSDWVEGGDQRAASYSLLPPGEYTFRVLAANNDGVWNEAGSALAIVVKPFFWQTRWFRFALPLSVAGLVAGFTLFAIRRRHQMQLERLRGQQAIQTERARIAQDLHDDLGATLTQISWLSSTTGVEPPDGEDSRNLLTEIMRKSQQMVRAIDEIVWAVNPKNDCLSQMIAYICQFAQDLLGTARMRCRIDLEEPLPEHALDSVIRHNLFLVLKEALHNAARHSHGGEVWLRVSTMPGGIRFVVEDDGIGLPPSVATGGDGMGNMRHRADSLGAKLEFSPRPGGGTRVTLEVPLK
jgi:signal transduction histidine kinase/ligand-binding sensor domain-containing protein